MRNAHDATSVSFDESRRTAQPTRYRHAPAMYRPAAPGPPATQWRFTPRIRKATDPIAIGRPVNKRGDADSSDNPPVPGPENPNHPGRRGGVTGEGGCVPP